MMMMTMIEFDEDGGRDTDPTIIVRG